MDFKSALHTFMAAAGSEAENVARRTLKFDLVLYVPDDPNAPGLRFGVGDHDWRLAYFQEPGKEPELLGIAEAARKFADSVLGHPEKKALIVKPTEIPQESTHPLPGPVVQKGLPAT